MSIIDTSTWNPDPELNESIGGIPLNESASIKQTWQAIQMLMAAGGLHGLKLVPFTGATSQEDGTSGLVPAPEAGDEDKVLRGDGTWGAIAAANHVHGNITNDGKLGTASRVVVTDGNKSVTVSGVTSTELGYLSGVTSAVQTQINGKADNQSLSDYVTLSGSQTVSNKTFSGTNGITFTDTSADSTRNILYGKMAANDLYRMMVGGASNAGYLEIATADDGSEPIYIRQYSGTFSTLKRTATILDASGNTSFPGTVTATGFTGNVTGNCSGTSGRAYRSAGNDTYVDIVQTVQSDNNDYRSCTIRCYNGNGYNKITLGAHDEANGPPGGIDIQNTAGTITVSTVTPSSTADNSTKIATTAWIRTATGNFACNAATATEFASAKSVTLTGDVIGSASSKAGWSIATTVGAITNAQIAAMFENDSISPDDPPMTYPERAVLCGDGAWRYFEQIPFPEG